MAPDDPADLERIDQQIRINEMKERARELSGGAMFDWTSDGCPSDIEESFWRHVLAYEEAPLVCRWDQLEQAGVELPPPETLGEQAVSAKLWEVIEALARMRVFVERTDHLSDRELYAWLWHKALREVAADIPLDECSSHHLDVLGACSEEDLQLSLKYYMDENERQQWKESFPEDDIPPHEDPPYDRDRLLPRATYRR